MTRMAKITNGEAVAKLLVDDYLNRNPSGHEKVMEVMEKERPEIRNNCTYLGFAWLEGLSETEFYDLRNEASKLMADDLCAHMEERPELQRISWHGSEDREVDAGDGGQVAQLLADYLSAASGSAYRDFVSYALRTHRTLQQNLTRFFIEWFAREEKECRLLKKARLVYSHYSLPFI